MISYFELNTFLAEYTERNTDNQYKPVAVGRYGIRTRESIYSKELAKDYSKNKVIFQNTLTVGMGSVQIDIGILTENVKYSVSPAYHTYKITGINPDYLRYCLECRNKDMFERYVKRGSRQGKTIDLGRWLTYEIPVCETQEQKEIVSKLDFFDSLITARREQLAKLDELVKSRFVELFGDIHAPSKWEKKPWSELVTIQNGRDYKNILVESGGYPVYGTGGEMARASDYLCPENTIIVGRKGTINNPLLVKEKFWNVDTAFGVIVGNQLHYQYFYNFCRMFDFSTLNKQAVLPSTTKADLLKIEIAVPPMELQNQFADFVEQTDKSKLAIQQSLEKLETLKKALMQKYFG